MAAYIETFYFLLFALFVYTTLSIIGVFAITKPIMNKQLRLLLRVIGCVFILFLGLSIVMAGFAS